MRKPSVVLDTNVIISGLILPKSKPGQIIRIWLSNNFHHVTSLPLLKELERILNYPKIRKKYLLTSIAVSELLNKIKNDSKVISNLILPTIFVRDKEDLIVIATALDGKAEYLITGDEDLLSMRNDPGINPLKIVTVEEFLNLFNN